MKKIFTLLLSLFLYGALNINAQKWDFTHGFSETTINNLKADVVTWATNRTDMNGEAVGWKNATTVSDTLTANDIPIPELLGLNFSSCWTNGILLDSTSIRLSRARESITLSGVKNGQTITVRAKSANANADNRYLEASGEGVSYISGPANGICYGSSLSVDNYPDVALGDKGIYTLVWSVATLEKNGVDVTITTGSGGIDFKSIEVSGSAELSKYDYIYCNEGRFKITDAANLYTGNIFDLTGWTLNSATGTFSNFTTDVDDECYYLKSTTDAQNEGMSYTYTPADPSASFVVSLKVKGRDADGINPLFSTHTDYGTYVTDSANIIKIVGVAEDGTETILNSGITIPAGWSTVSFGIVGSSDYTSYKITLEALNTSLGIAGVAIQSAIQVADLRKRDAALKYADALASLMPDWLTNEYLEKYRDVSEINGSSTEDDLEVAIDELETVIDNQIKVSLDDQLTEEQSHCGLWLKKLQKQSTWGEWTCYPAGRAHCTPANSYPEFGHYVGNNYWGGTDTSGACGISMNIDLKPGKYVFVTNAMGQAREQVKSSCWDANTGLDYVYGTMYAINAAGDTIATTGNYDISPCKYTQGVLTLVVAEAGTYSIWMQSYAKEENVNVKLGGTLYLKDVEFYGFSGNVRYVASTIALKNWTSTNTKNASVSSNTYKFSAEKSDALSFDWNVSSEESADYLIATLDGVDILKQSGTQSGNYYGSISSDGIHELTVKYVKNASGSANNDVASVSAVKVINRKTSLSEMYLPDQIDSITASTDIHADKLQYVRTFNNTYYQPLFVPFAMSYSDWSSKYDVCRLNDIHQYDQDDDGVVDLTVLEVFKVKSGSIDANIPYVIKAKTVGTDTITVNNVTISIVEPSSFDCSSFSTKYTFTGTYKAISGSDLVANNCYVLGDGALGKVTSSSVNLGAMRWYMEQESRSGYSSASKIVLRIFGEEDEATGITTTYDTPVDEPVSMYDIVGRKVNEAQNGQVVIMNGKKYLKK